MDKGPVEFVQFLELFDRIGDGWLAIVVIGLFAGVIARAMTSRSRETGFLSTALLGIAGAALGVYGLRAVGFELEGPGSRFLAALVGSLVLAWIGGLLFRRKTPAG